MKIATPFSTGVLVSALLLGMHSAHAATRNPIDLKEELGYAFAPQVLHYNVTVPQGTAKTDAHFALKDDKGVPVLAQFKPLGTWGDGSLKQVQVEFVAGLQPYEERHYTLDESGQAAKDDGALKLTHEGDSIVLSSPLVAVRIPALSKVFEGDGLQAQQVPPPVSQVRGKVNWYGSGSLDSVQNVRERHVSIAEDGPISKEVSIEYTFSGGEKYVVDVTLNRGEELVRMVEDYSLTFTEPTRTEFAFNLAPGLNPDRSVDEPVQRGPQSDSLGSLWDLNPYHGDMYPISYDRNDTYGAIVPWTPGGSGQWLHFACYNSQVQGGDMVGIITTAPERWNHIAYTVSPGDSWKLVQDPHLFFTMKMVKNVPITVGTDKSLTAHFHLNTGHREWAFFVSDAFPRTEQVTTGTGAAAVTTTYNSGPRAFFSQKAKDYYWNSLDRIKDYVLEWKADKNLAYPHMYASKAEYEERRAKYNAWSGANPMPAIDDPAVQAKLKTVVLGASDDAMRLFMSNPGPPHHIAGLNYPLANLSDLLLGTGTLTPLEETRLKARLAYMAYMMNWQAYWAPEMGYAANPNMSAFTYDAVGLYGLLLRDHPESRTWIKSDMTQLDREMANWISQDGAWIESTHYTLASWQEHTMTMAALKHMGIKDYYRDPRVRKFFEYYFYMQTPPDPEYNFQRSIPQIGNAYAIEACDEFGFWAKGMEDVDPEFAGNMMWMWKAAGHGTPAEEKGKNLTAYGGSFSSWWLSDNGNLPKYYELALRDPTIAPIEPKPTDGHKFEGFGAVLDAHFGGPKETKMYYRSGPFYSHWDADEGSFIIWAKGAPLSMDHGYGEFQPWLHNRVVVNHLYDESRGDISAFFAGHGSGFIQSEVVLDNLSEQEYHGTRMWPTKPEPINGRRTATPWSRRVTMMKDADPDGMNYFVVRDHIDGELPAEWNLWLYGTVADFNAQPIRATGKFGVDMLVYLLDRDKGKVETADVQMPPDRRKQTLVHLLRPAGEGVLSVLFPVVAGEAAPTVTDFGDNDDGAKIETPGRTDWVFCPGSPETIALDVGSHNPIEFSGIGAVYSQRGAAGYYMVDRESSVSAKGLEITSNAPLELTLDGLKLTGHSSSRDAQATITLSGPVAQRAIELTCNGTKSQLFAQDGKVTFVLPLGDVDFEIDLR